MSIRPNINDLGQYTKVINWTRATLMCYKRGCVCSGCEYSYLMRDGFKCQVKGSVLESVRVLGKPFERSEVVISE